MRCYEYEDPMVDKRDRDCKQYKNLNTINDAL